jgi:elongation factor P
MKISGNDIRPGNVIRHKDKLWRAVKTQAVKPGKGPAYNQVELKALMENTKLNERFRASETVERVRLETRDHTFLYGDDETLTFMDSETFEQIEIPTEFVGEQRAFLQDGMTVSVEAHEGQPIGVQLPQHVTQTITEAEPVVKGQTASASYKPAVLDNGVRISVPPHIEAGQNVVVDTGTFEYVRRADS